MTATAPLPADFDAELFAAEEPHALIHALRAADPVHWVELGFWLVTRHEDVRRLFNDPEHVSGDRRLWEHHVPREAGTWLRWVEDHGLFARSPADHLRLRRLVSAAFTPRAIRRMEAQIAAVVERAAAALAARGGEVIDLYGGFTNVVPNAVISRITGVPPGDDEARFRELAQSAIAGFLPFTPPEQVARADASFGELAEWVRALCAERRRQPREDLVSDLLQAQESDERLGDDDVVILLTSLVSAGSETTALGGARLIEVLLGEPEAAERLRADRALLARSIGELIRFSMGGPMGLPRFAVRDFELRGRRIRRGQMLLLSFGGANRDPAVFPDPDRLDLERDVRALLAFGAGPHFCLGAHLARTELVAMLGAVLDLLPAGSRVIAEQRRYVEAGLFRRPANLPVAVGPGGRPPGAAW